MSHSGYSVLQTIESNAIGAAVGAIVGGTVSGLYKRAVRLEARRIEALLLNLDHLLGGQPETTTTPENRFPRMFPTLAQYRKGIAAGVGVIFTGVLTWAETADLEPIVGPLVPEPFRPLVGVFFGGVALTASVILASNAPGQAAQPASDGSGATLVPAVAVVPSAAAAAAAARPSAALASLVAGVAAGATPPGTVTSETSVVQLLDPPVRAAYQ